MHVITRNIVHNCLDKWNLGILKKESGWLTPMRPIQKVREMLVFASSPEYLTLREGVGLAVTQ